MQLYLVVYFRQLDLSVSCTNPILSLALGYNKLVNDYKSRFSITEF